MRARARPGQPRAAPSPARFRLDPEADDTRGRDQGASAAAPGRKHFLTARIAGSDPETLPPADPHLLRVVNVTNTTTPEEIGAAARLARQDKQWLILMFHWMVDEAS